MTADQDLSARLAELNGNANGGSKAALLGFWDALDEAWSSGQLMTLADHERAVQAAVAKAVESCAVDAMAAINACREDGDTDLRSVRAWVDAAIRARKGDAL